jgi:lysophospholipase L1-like esterase
LWYFPRVGHSSPTFTGYACAAALLGAVILLRCTGTTQAPARDLEPAAASATVASPAASAGVEPPEAAAPPGPQRYSVAALGDSLTDPRSQGGKYLDYLRERCPKSRFDGYGKGGEMVNQMRRRFAADVFGDVTDAAPRPFAYTHVIVFGGVNDLLSDKTAFRTPKKIESDLIAIYAAAREHRARVIAITVAPWGGHPDYNPSRAEATREVNRFIAEQRVAGTVDHVVDSVPLLSCGNPERVCARYGGPFKDGLHFGAEGHKVLGEALLREAFSDCE